MAVSAYPGMVDALVAQMAAPLTSLGAIVADAMPADDDPADFLAVGLPSLSESGSIFSGSSQQDWATTGAQGARTEEGEVRCIAAARSTDESVKSARDRAAAIFEAVSTLTRSGDLTLGVTQLLWTSVGTRTDWGLLYEVGQPVAVFVEFTVEYRARL